MPASHQRSRLPTPKINSCGSTKLTRAHEERTTRPNGSGHERHWQWKVKSLAQVWGYLDHCRFMCGYSYSTSSWHLSIQFKVIKDQPDSPDSRLTLGGSEGLGLPEGVVKLLRKQLLTCHILFPYRNNTSFAEGSGYKTVFQGLQYICIGYPYSTGRADSWGRREVIVSPITPKKTVPTHN